MTAVLERLSRAYSHVSLYTSTEVSISVRASSSDKVSIRGETLHLSGGPLFGLLYGI
jgi:hypothetical protein